VNSIQSSATITLGDFSTHLFLLQGFSAKYFNTINVVFWSISIEVGFYLIFPIFYFITLKKGILAALLVSLLVSLISITAISLISLTPTSPLRFAITNLWFGWCCGAAIAYLYTLNTRLWDKIKTKQLSVLIFLSFVILIIAPSTHQIISDQLHILFWISILILCIKQESYFEKRSNYLAPVVALGVSSYSLYLLHEPLISLKNFIASSYLPEGYRQFVVIGGILLIPLICHFNYLIFEKPFFKYRKV
jgi:peptidoglycan/LPS O-acetylase OafA/YrhL